MTAFISLETMPKYPYLWGMRRASGVEPGKSSATIWNAPIGALRREGLRLSPVPTVAASVGAFLFRRMMETEEWRAVVGWEGIYEVSSLGRVRSLERQRLGYRGKLLVRPSRILAARPDAKGYLRVNFGAPGRKKDCPLVHRLVAMAFIGPCPLGHNCNHKDADKTNNRPENLEWVTPKENTRHAMRHGLMDWSKALRGEAVGSSVLTASQVLEMRRVYARGGITHEQLSARFGVSDVTVWKILNRKAWTHV